MILLLQGFDVDVTIPVESFSMHKMKKNETGYFRDLTDIYARLGLHCYNSPKVIIYLFIYFGLALFVTWVSLSHILLNICVLRFLLS